MILEGWLWDVQCSAAKRRSEGGAPTWRLSFAVPRLLLPPFEDAFAEEAAAILTSEIPPGEVWRVEALFSAPPDFAAWQRRLATVAESAGIAAPALDLALLPDVDWVAESLRKLPPVRVGRFFVHGQHDAHRLPAAAIPLRIEAGRAFGTGQHQTTCGCLLALDRLARARRFRRIADLGTGSGILSLAAARLWRVPVLGGDVDPESVKTARGNARRNRQHRLTRFVQADGLAHRAFRAGAPYDLILANILAGPLVALAPAIRRMTAPGARVVLSGLLKRQEQQVLAPYRSLGLVLERRIEIGDWPTLILKRR